MGEAGGISRRYLHDEVATQLRALIQTGQIRPDERLNECELAERFGISRTPLREAIKILATEGLLELLPNRGARVARFSEAEVEEMLVVIAVLEGAAGELACQAITPEELERVGELNARMSRAHAEQDVPGYFEINRAIHDAIMSAARNSALEAVYRKACGRIQQARFAAHKTQGQWDEAMRDHDRMVQLLRDRDADALGRLMRAHVMSKKAVIIATFGD